MLLKNNNISIAERNQSRFYKSNLNDLIKQKPNKKTFGIAKLQLGFFYLGSGRNDNYIKQFFRYKLGEPPVILDSFLIERSITSMRNYLGTQGFYYPEINFDVKTNRKGNKAKVNYRVKLNNAYHLYRIELHTADYIIDSILNANKSESFLRYGDKMKLENLYNEQNRITNVLRNNGYFSFRKEEINFDIDTTEGNFKVAVAPNINNPVGFGRYKVYKIKNINIEINPTADTVVNYLDLKKFNYKSNNYLLNPKVIENALLIENNLIFNQQKVTRSINRINDLQLFRNVNFSAIVDPNADTPEITYNIKLQSNKKYDLSIEPQAITTDQANIISGATFRNYGFATVFQLMQPNVFNGGELLQWRFRTSFEAQRGPNIPNRPFINSFENALTANIILPKFLFFEKYDKQIKSITNRTVFSASAIMEQNVDWKRYLLTTSLNYQITKLLINFNITPVAISFVKTDFANKNLEQLSKNDPFLQSIFTNNLIFDSRFGFTYTNQPIKKNKNSIFIRWDAIEIAGNTINALHTLFATKNPNQDFNTIFGVPIFQYVKTWADFRFNNFLDVNNKLVYRLAAGFALPYGNTPDYVPFDRRFFIGGANSIRAFLPRSLGPGSFESESFFDRSGDVKIEANIEYRFNLYNRLFEGALFSDVGNIYRIKPDGRPGANFELNNFYKSLAAGVGLGLRLNLDFLVFRVDPSLPLYDPRKPENERWVPSNKGSLTKWLGTTNINFGVGYPF